MVTFVARDSSGQVYHTVNRDHHDNFNLIRLLAALQVFVVHSHNHFGIEGPLLTALNGVPGVPTFYFISGLLICGSYQRLRLHGLRAFFTNRVLRIYPALWVCVALSILVVAATGYLYTQHFSSVHFILWLLGQGSIFQFYNPEFMRAFGVGVLNGVLWTITVELQFYALTPLLFWLLIRRRAWLLTVFVLSLALNVYFRHFLDWTRTEIKLLYVSFMPWVYMFILGFIAMYYREQAQRLIARLRLRYLIPAYVLSMLVIGPYEFNASNRINPVSFVLLAACLLKISTARLPIPQWLARFVARNDFSYGLYLYHMPIVNVLIFLGLFSPSANLAFAFAGTGIAAILSWYVVERPVLRHKR